MIFFGGVGGGGFRYSGGRANWLLGNSSSILVHMHPVLIVFTDSFAFQMLSSCYIQLNHDVHT